MFVGIQAWDIIAHLFEPGKLRSSPCPWLWALLQLTHSGTEISNSKTGCTYVFIVTKAVCARHLLYRDFLIKTKGSLLHFLNSGNSGLLTGLKVAPVGSFLFPIFVFKSLKFMPLWAVWALQATVWSHFCVNPQTAAVRKLISSIFFHDEVLFLPSTDTK